MQESLDTKEVKQYSKEIALSENYIVKEANISEYLEFIQDGMTNEGWNPGVYDSEAFFRADPNGYFIGYLNGQPISSISAIRWGEKFGFIGAFIVKKDFRGKGFGFQLFKLALRRLQGLNISLEAVMAQEHNYMKNGFKTHHMTILFKGISQIVNDYPFQQNIVKLQEIEFSQLLNYNQPFFPEDRQEFLRSWINLKESVALGIIENNQLKGYGVIWKAVQGYGIGPLFADDERYAKALLLALQSNIQEKSTFYMYVPELNKDGINLLATLQVQPCNKFARMYTGDFINFPFDRIYAITSAVIG